MTQQYVPPIHCFINCDDVLSHCLKIFECSCHYPFTEPTLRRLTLVGVSGDKCLKGKRNSVWNRWKMNRSEHLILFASWFVTLFLIFRRDIPFLLSTDICRAFWVSFSFISYTKAAKMKEMEPSGLGFRRQWSRGCLAVILGLLWVITAVPFPPPTRRAHKRVFLWFQIPLPQEFRW